MAHPNCCFYQGEQLKSIFFVTKKECSYQPALILKSGNQKRNPRQTVSWGGQFPPLQKVLGITWEHFFKITAFLLRLNLLSAESKKQRHSQEQNKHNELSRCETGAHQSDGIQPCPQALPLAQENLHQALLVECSGKIRRI